MRPKNTGRTHAKRTRMGADLSFMPPVGNLVGFFFHAVSPSEEKKVMGVKMKMKLSMKSQKETREIEEVEEEHSRGAGIIGGQ